MNELHSGVFILESVFGGPTYGLDASRSIARASHLRRSGIGHLWRIG